MTSSSSQSPRSPSRTTNPCSSRSSTPTQYSQDRDISGGHPATGLSQDRSTYPYTGYSDNQQRPSSSQQQRDSQQQVAQRGRWHALLGEAGGFSAAWSEESMRRLRYVLQCLQVTLFPLLHLVFLIVNSIVRYQSHRRADPDHPWIYGVATTTLLRSCHNK